jgi:transposase
MASPYSLDLRLKAVDAVDQGKPKCEVCRMFGISRNTLDLWLKRREATGSLAANTDYHHGPQPKIDDLEEFRTFAEQYGHLTQKEMAKLWPTPVSATTIGLALKRINFSRKKNLSLSRTR